MIRFPAALTPETFLRDFWQKQPWFMPGAIDGPEPALTRDELGWLATLEDVESRIIFTDRSGQTPKYNVESGPFDEAYLRQLPTRDWTLLVHDVEKHLPELRALFNYVPFIPDWRIDDLMVSFAAPGGGVGPHKDHYDVFLCQGTGSRNWQVETQSIAADPSASRDLALLAEFTGRQYTCERGDVLYLPPGVAHWGTADSACLTYSIGMRAPQLSDLVAELPDTESVNPFYTDPDMSIAEVRPGYIPAEARRRAAALAGGAITPSALGRSATLTKDWLTPECATQTECDQVLDALSRGQSLDVHGMARIAWDDARIYANGKALETTPESCKLMSELCARRTLPGPLRNPDIESPIVRWLLERGTFELPATS